MFNYLTGLIKSWADNKERRRLRNVIEKSFDKKHLTSWEKKFLASIENRDLLKLSTKQLRKLNEISASPDIPRIRGQSQHFTVFDDAWEDENSDPRYSDRHGVSYDDVHDFDK